jgi:hypothetical protein
MAAPEDERGVLCDDCWQQFMVWMRENYGPPPWPHLDLEGRPANA